MTLIDVKNLSTRAENDLINPITLQKYPSILFCTYNTNPSTKKGFKYIQIRKYLTPCLTVLQVLDHLDESATVYKMIGPVLVKQDTDESQQNVQKRINYIAGEL